MLHKPSDTDNPVKLWGKLELKFMTSTVAAWTRISWPHRNVQRWEYPFYWTARQTHQQTFSHSYYLIPYPLHLHRKYKMTIRQRSSHHCIYTGSIKTTIRQRSSPPLHLHRLHKNDNQTKILTSLHVHRKYKNDNQTKMHYFPPKPKELTNDLLSH